MSESRSLGRLLIAMAVGAVAALPIASAGVVEAAPLVVSASTTTRVAPDTTTALAGLSVGGTDGAQTRVTLSTDVGTLSISTTTGLTLEFANSWSGTPSITFSGLEADINAALGTVSITTPAGDATAEVGLTAAPADDGFFYESSDQRIFEFVADAGITWTAADAASRARTYRGQPGYLAAPVSAAANDFVTSKIEGANDVWIGLRAYQSGAEAQYKGSARARVWRAVVGADQSPEAGEVVGVCTSVTGSCDYFDNASYFSSWASGEPNNSGSNESVAVTNWSGSAGQWNDLSPATSGGIGGYVVQYGGKTNADPDLGTGFSGIVTASSDVVIAAAATVPNAPTVSAESADSAISLSWRPPSNGGDPITSYEVSIDGGTWSAVSTSSTSETVDGNVVVTVSTSVTGLVNGQSYDVRVRAVNSVGAGAPSVAVTETPLAVPDAPTSVVGTPGDGAVSVSFAEPGDDGGSAITGYTATAAPGGATADCTVSPCSVTGLANGTAYTFTVTALNGVGVSDDSTASASVTPRTVPGAPTSVSATYGNESISVSFSAPSDDGGAAVSGYTVTGAPGGIDVDCAASPCAVMGLTNGTAYTLTVVATNVAGDSVASSSVSATPRTVPGNPTDLVATPGDQSISVAFSAPPDDGGAAISGFTVIGAPGDIDLGCAASPCVVTGLTNGTEYTLRAVATNTEGDSIASPTVAATPRTVPGAPTRVIAEQTGVGTATVSFSPPSKTGGSAVTGYRVTSLPGGVITDCPASPCEVAGFAVGSSITYTVAARNAAGTGAGSAPSSALTFKARPTPPADVEVTSTQTSITAVFDDSSADATTYEVTLTPGSITVTCDSSPCTIDGLDPGVTYSVHVVAIGPAGRSSGGASLDVRTDRATGGFVPMRPSRLLDSRTSDAFRPGEVREISLVGVDGLPEDATSVIANLTAVQPTTDGFLSVVPCGTDNPATSNVNFVAGATTAGSAIVDTNRTRSICVYSSASTDVVIDIDGATSPSVGASRLHAIQPRRALDTRTDGTRLAAGAVTRISLLDVIPADSDAVVVNATVVGAASAGFVTVFDCDGDVPNASSLNFDVGRAVPNAVTTEVGVDGDICAFSPTEHHLIVDVMAYYAIDPSADVVQTIDPIRLADTRIAERGPVVAGEVLIVELPLSGGEPVAAAVVNVTSAAPTASGFITAFTCGDEPPLSSNVNFIRGDNSANSATVAPDAEGRICVFASATTHVLVDLFATRR